MSERGTPTSPRRSPDRCDLIAILAAMGNRSPAEVAEEIGSLELAWLLSEVERRYRTQLELDDAALAQMTTVSGAVATIHRLLEGTADG